MLKQTGNWRVSPLHSLFPTASNLNTAITPPRAIRKALKLSTQERVSSISCNARRRSVRYEEKDEDEGEYGHNEEIAKLELYSGSAREEALVVHALVDEQEVEVLIFKGFSSCLSYKTAADPSKSVIPSRAVIKEIDRIKGPFDPSNIEYIEKGLTWEAFQTRLPPST